MSIKIYIDTVSYYAILLFGVLFGAVSHAYQWKWKRLSLPLIFRDKWGLFPGGCSTLEAFAVALVVALFVFWFCFWSFSYRRIAQVEELIGGCINIS